MTAADVQTKALGYSAMARVYTPHPIPDRTDDEIVADADAVLDEIVREVVSARPSSEQEVGSTKESR